ncbi:MAG: EscU/YscU/HrcU family type III secretion system export apparatus switch protein [Acidimicrobiales bacterium]
MAKNDTGDKTEKPTPKKLREARKKGQIPRSPDLVGWVVLFVSSFVLPSAVTSTARALSTLTTDGLAAAAAGDDGRVMSLGAEIPALAGLAMAPLLAVAFMVTALGMVVQGGVALSLDPLKPKAERISPKAGIKRLFSSQSLVDTGKAVARLVVLGALVANVITGAITAYLGSASTDLGVIGPLLAADVLLLVRLAAIAGIVVGFGDYAFQRHKINKQLKMSKHEVKQETKNSEGDAMVRQRRRAMHAQLNRNQMLAAVPDASVVVVNPTHVAVALKYESGGVPRVVAKGGDDLAMRIRERAFGAGVPVVEVRPLARVLFDVVDIGSEVPARLYEAVAIVIAFVMRTPSSTVGGAIRRVNVPGRLVRE